MEHKSLAIIPARGGSKGLKKKNLRLLGGKPLIAYAIEVARAGNCFDEIMVSTEDEEIAEAARAYGASVPFLRPNEFAQDKSSLQDVIDDVLERYRADGYVPDVIGTMLPTSPFRSAKMVREMTLACLRTHCRFISTVRRIQQSAIFTRAETEETYAPMGDLNKIMPGAYCRVYGAYQARRLAAHLPSEQLRIYELKHPAEWVDIDTKADLELAERIIEKGLYQFDYEN